MNQRSILEPRASRIANTLRLAPLFVLLLGLSACDGSDIGEEPDYPNARAQLVATFTPLPQPTATLTPLPSATATEVYSTPTPDVYVVCHALLLAKRCGLDVDAAIERKWLTHLSS